MARSERHTSARIGILAKNDPRHGIWRYAETILWARDLGSEDPLATLAAMGQAARDAGLGDALFDFADPPYCVTVTQIDTPPFAVGLSTPPDGSAANPYRLCNAAQLAYLLDGIDWRNPRHSFRPERVG